MQYARNLFGYDRNSDLHVHGELRWSRLQCLQSRFQGASCNTSVAEKFGPTCDYGQVCGVDIPAVLSKTWEPPNAIPWDIDNLGVGSGFTRVDYRLTLDNEVVWVEMDQFTRDKTKIGVPAAWVWDILLTNVSVISSAASVASIPQSEDGKMGFWPSNFWPVGRRQQCLRLG